MEETYSNIYYTTGLQLASRLFRRQVPKGQEQFPVLHGCRPELEPLLDEKAKLLETDAGRQEPP